MKLYSAVFVARRIIDDQVEVQVNPMLLLEETEEAAFQEANRTVLELFAPSEGWIDQKMIWLEIEEGLVFDDGRRLTWQIEEPPSTKEDTHGESNITNT
jgi:hypothetical protein